MLPIDFCAESARYSCIGKFGQGWIRTSEGVKPADLQSAPFGHFGTYPSSARDFIYPRAPQLATDISFRAAIDSAKANVTFGDAISAERFLVRVVRDPDFFLRGAVRVRAARFCQRSSERVCPGKIIRREANRRNRGK